MQSDLISMTQKQLDILPIFKQFQFVGEENTVIKIQNNKFHIKPPKTNKIILDFDQFYFINKNISHLQLAWNLNSQFHHISKNGTIKGEQENVH